MLPIAIADLEAPYIWMIDRQIPALDESEAKELLGDMKGRLDHAVEREIAAQF